MTLREAKPGDVVRIDTGLVVVFGLVAGASWIRFVTEEGWRCISQPVLCDPGMECQLVKLGVERFPKQGNQQSVDPLEAA